MSPGDGQTARTREASADDAAKLARFAERTFREAFAAWNSSADMNLHCAESFSADIQRREIDHSNYATILAEDGDDLIGFAQLRIRSAQRHVEAERTSELYRLYVSRKWHGAGIARQLMNEVLKKATREATEFLWLGVWEHNPRAIAFYRKCGFRIVGEHEFRLGKDVQRDLVMSMAVE